MAEADVLGEGPLMSRVFSPNSLNDVGYSGGRIASLAWRNRLAKARVRLPRLGCSVARSSGCSMVLCQRRHFLYPTK